MAFPGGIDAVMGRDRSILTQPHIPVSPRSMAKIPITASHFQPVPIALPRAWERVPVPAVVDHTRQRKIWKRVGGLSNSTLPNSYAATMIELESGGNIPRKRARPARFVPVFGDAKWDQRCNQPCDGKWDLIEARVAVSAAKEAIPENASSSETTPRFIPRKRHNSRWPIEPKTTPTQQLAELQPLIVFEVPSAAEPVEPAQNVDEKNMRRRSTRRLSRRLSLFPGEESPRKLESRSRSPSKTSGPVLSPTKRAAIASSPTRVAESPRRLFSVDLPSKELLLTSPATTLPAMSPCKSSPLPAVQQQDAIDACLSASVQPDQAEASPLLFDQPIPTITVEPQHETRRRISLLSARRSDRRSSGFLKMVDFDAARDAPKRRHSFNPSQSAPPDLKARRSSLDVFSNVPDEAHRTKTADDNIPVAYEVDVGTNLDIFGQSRQLKPRETFIKPTVDVPTSHNLDIQSGVTGSEGKEEEAVNQAAASPDPGPDAMDNADRLDPIPDSHSPNSEENSPYVEPDAMPSDFEFGPHDPEGLSTIYEEDSVLDVNSPRKANMADASITGNVAGVTAGSPVTTTTLSQVDVIFDGQLQEDADETEDVGTSPSAQSIHHVEDASGLSNHEQRASDEEKPAALDETIPAVDPLSTPHSPEGSSSEARSSSDPEMPNVAPENDPAPCIHHSDEMEIDEPQTSNIPVADPAPVMVADGATLTPERPTTPQMAKVSQHSEAPMVSQEDPDSLGSPHSSESSGFTPINGRQISPSSTAAKQVELYNDGVDSGDAELDDLDQDEVGDVEEFTNVVDEDFTLNVVDAPKPENDTLTLARHDDADFVRDFVSRVAAGKSAKAAAAATVATEVPRKVGRPKRRSGSTGSATTCTGSPISKSDTPKRSPLSEKSLNSPSPVKPAKKRKLEAEEEDTSKPKGDMDDGPEDGGDGNGPKLKRRRKRADPVLDEPAEGPSEPDGTTGPRRSTRARSTRITLKSAGPSANSIAMSLYPVRLPGGVAGMMDDSVLDSHLTLSRQRSEAKSIEAITRGNTRANKAGAVLPQVVLARLAEDPSWKMKELKGVFDAKESRAAANGDEDSADSNKSKKAKGVRWDPELVRYQSDDSSSNKVIRTMAKSLLDDIMRGEGADEEDELSMPVVSVSKPRDENASPTEKSLPAPTPIKKAAAPLRRTRSSRLQVPTPVKKLAGGGSIEKKSSTIISPPTVSGRPVRATTSSTKTSKTSKTSSTATTKSIPTPTTSTSTTKSATSSKQSGMATRRTKIASLNMGVNGTPAPKRRGRPAASQ
ncbi:hypothetical protein V8F06_008927 [Rhypophila decipiens]